MKKIRVVHVLDGYETGHCERRDLVNNATGNCRWGTGSGV